MKLGFFGGSFNPPHKGHQHIIEYCSKEFDKFIVIPYSNSPDSTKKNPILFKHRYNMLQLQFGNTNIEIDDCEANSNQTNFTYLTIQYLIQKYNQYKICMILGEDQLYNLSTWTNIDFILQNVEIYCFKRKSKTKHLKLINNVKFINLDFPFSSSYIRKQIKTGKSIASKIINKDVLNYIKENNLYL